MMKKKQQPTGMGKLTYEDGSFYEGPVVKGRREGKLGIMHYTDGKVYMGEWRRDMREGRGLLKLADTNTKLCCGVFREDHFLDDKHQLW